MNQGIGLGTGLSSPPSPHQAGELASVPRHSTIIQQVPTERVQANPHQPRSVFAHEALEALMQSIREHGILQPLVVTKHADGYELIAGERRLRAARLLDLPTVPAIIRQATEQQKLELALIENIQRRDLDPIERAHAYQKLAEQFSLTQDAVAKRLGTSRVAVANTIRLLQLPDEVQRVLQEGTISEGQAKVLLSLPTAEQQIAFCKRVIKEHLTVRELEAHTSDLRKRRKRPKSRPKNIDDETQEAELRDALGTKVSIDHTDGEGKVIIHYYSEEDLRAIIERIMNARNE